MASIIKIKRSETASSVPAAGVLDTGEVALNTVDKDSDWMIKQHKVDVELLAYHARSPDSCVLAVRWLLQSLPKVESSLLNDKYCLGLDNAELINKYRLTGEKQLVRAIRENVSNILNTYVIKPRA